MSRRRGETAEAARERINAARRHRYATDPAFRERILAQGAADRAKPERVAQRRASQKAYLERIDTPEWRVADRLKRRARKYGITVDEVTALLAQGCGVCGEADNVSARGLHIDHDHDCCPGVGSCGRCIRGVLCYADNIHFERFLDSPRVIAYLGRTEAGRATLERNR